MHTHTTYDSSTNTSVDQLMASENCMSIYYGGIQAVLAENIVPNHIKIRQQKLFIGHSEIDLQKVGKLKLLCIGKAAAGMAKATESILGKYISSGLCITKYKHSLPLQHCAIIEAAHPIPDENSTTATHAALALVANSKEEDIVLVMLSGGASSLIANVPNGCTLHEIQKTFDVLVNSGASIHEINCVRKHLSLIKGGQLAKAAYPASVYTCILSDVVDDKLEVIASGPTVPDSTTVADALAVISKFQLNPILPTAILNYLQTEATNNIYETPKPGDTIFNKTFTYIIANNSTAINGAIHVANTLGYYSSVYRYNIIGNTEIVANEFVDYLHQYKGMLPACIIAGGETTLRLTNKGKGGRNQHFALCATKALLQQKNDKKITILCCGTDGSDGPTDAAGAITFNFTEHPLHINEFVKNFNSYTYFEQVGGLIKTGPTQTNVMDIVIALIHE